MGAELSVINDHPNFIVRKASIFTPSQGICLQRLEDNINRSFKFDKGLAYGSWYDIQIIGQAVVDDEETPVQRYLKRGIYLSYGKAVRMNELTSDSCLDLGREWLCSECKEVNIGSVAICEYCDTNCHQKWISWVSYTPALGIPFSIADAVLQSGKAALSNTSEDKIEAGITTATAVVDVVTGPFMVGSAAVTGTKALAQVGAKLTAKKFASEVGIRVGGAFLKAAAMSAATKKAILATILLRRRGKDVNEAATSITRMATEVQRTMTYISKSLIYFIFYYNKVYQDKEKCSTQMLNEI
ncbi:unnamed protein product [Adineta steineri]|uniref:RanBP2-type domain-containing protein n=1 Tax=Adineta steineri TaxID=433720 RepID=A0A814SH02_9BILA|nr:unnamed protein product [Adineta steineri]CAF1145915.1 unnamed protein product [Adineta steineri]